MYIYIYTHICLSVCLSVCIQLKPSYLRQKSKQPSAGGGCENEASGSTPTAPWPFASTPTLPQQVLLHMCSHSTAYICVCVLLHAYVSACCCIQMCPHTAAYKCVRILLHTDVSAYCCIQMCPHTTAYICACILLHAYVSAYSSMCPHTTAYICVLELLTAPCLRPHTSAA